MKVVLVLMQLLLMNWVTTLGSITTQVRIVRLFNTNSCFLDYFGKLKLFLIANNCRNDLGSELR